MNFLSLHKVTELFRQSFPIIIIIFSTSSFWKSKISTEVQTYLDVDQNQIGTLHVGVFLFL